MVRVRIYEEPNGEVDIERVENDTYRSVDVPESLLERLEKAQQELRTISDMIMAHADSQLPKRTEPCGPPFFMSVTSG